VTFTLKDAAGLPVVGAETKGFDFHIAKLIPASATGPAHWQSYVNRSTRGFSGTGTNVFAATYERGSPVAVAGTPGTYTYTFCTPLATVATFQYYGSGTEPAGSCSTTAVSRSGQLAGAAWDGVKGGLDLAYSASATTRIAIAGPTNSFVNIVKDFVPAQLPTLLTAMANQVTTNASCGACHAEDSDKRDKIVIGTKGQGHTGRRFDVELCSVCHNPGSFDPNPALSTAASWHSVDLKALIHQFHAEHYTQNAPFGGVSNIGTGWNNNVASKGVMNCRTCHDNQNPKILPFHPANRSTADKDAWKTQITRQSCDTCHNGTVSSAVDYNNHPLPGIVQPGNARCSDCHGQGTDALSKVNVAHATPYSTFNNPELALNAKKVEYQIASMTVDATTRQPTVKFRVLVDGQPLNLKALPAGITLGALNMKLAWSSPLAASATGNATPWTAINNPLDWNNLGGAPRTFWGLNSTTTPASVVASSFVQLQEPQPVPAPGTTPPATAAQRAFDQPTTANINTALVNTLTGPDPEGYFITPPGISATPLAFPAGTTLRAVAIESYLTISNMNISGRAAMKGEDGATDTLRRKIVDIDNCNTCHERVGFHSNAGRMDNPDYCATCHNPQLSNSNLFEGKATFPLAPGGAEFTYQQASNNFKDMIHALHAGAERKAQNSNDLFNFIRGNPGASGGSGPMVFQDFVYPAKISDCKTCHLPGTYKVPSNPQFMGSVQKAPVNTTMNVTIGGVVTAVPASTALGLNAGAYATSSGNFLRDGPATAACGSCHNSPSAKAHFATNTAPGFGESCASCHGAGAAFEAHKQ
jgi:OmcA/MtrC family decaheme c-type cytochrome